MEKQTRRKYLYSWKKDKDSTLCENGAFSCECLFAQLICIPISPAGNIHWSQMEVKEKHWPPSQETMNKNRKCYHILGNQCPNIGTSLGPGGEMFVTSQKNDYGGKKQISYIKTGLPHSYLKYGSTHEYKSYWGECLILPTFAKNLPTIFPESAGTRNYRTAGQFPSKDEDAAIIFSPSEKSGKK